MLNGDFIILIQIEHYSWEHGFNFVFLYNLLDIFVTHSFDGVKEIISFDLTIFVFGEPINSTLAFPFW